MQNVHLSTKKVQAMPKEKNSLKRQSKSSEPDMTHVLELSFRDKYTMNMQKTNGKSSKSRQTVSAERSELYGRLKRKCSKSKHYNRNEECL